LRRFTWILSMVMALASVVINMAYS
jgi:predicted outer membrane lipoprotein